MLRLYSNCNVGDAIRNLFVQLQYIAQKTNVGFVWRCLINRVHLQCLKKYNLITHAKPFRKLKTIK